MAKYWRRITTATGQKIKVLALYYLCSNFSTSNHHNAPMLSCNPGHHKTPLKQIQLANFASRIRNVTETGHKCMFLFVRTAAHEIFECCYTSS